MAYTENDGFELADANLCDGDGNYWTDGLDAGTATLVGDSTEFVYAGNYAARFQGQHDGNNSEYAMAYHDLSAGGNDEYFQFRMRVKSIAADIPNRYATLCQGRTGPTTRVGVEINYQSANEYRLRILVNHTGGNSYTYGANNFSVGEWIMVEVRYFSNAANGGAQVWVNEVLEVEDLTRDTSPANVSRWYLGMSLATTLNNATVDFDQVYDHTEYMGNQEAPPEQQTIYLTWTR